MQQATAQQPAPSAIHAIADGLRAELAAHAERYYLHDAPAISDQAYDRLFADLQALERRYPDLAHADSPTQTVGAASATAKVEHRAPMLSMAAAHSLEDARAFDQQVRAALATALPEYIVEPKFDGCAISLTYARGLLVLAATRGDGARGENITAAARACADIPTLLQGDNVPELVEIRGEVFQPRDRFDALNARRAVAGDAPFTHPRNVASATLRANDPHAVAERGLAFSAFEALTREGLPLSFSLSDTFDLMTDWGLPVTDRSETALGIDAAIEIAQRLGRERDQYGAPIDGVTIKLNHRHEQRRLGNTSRAPRWAIALKALPEPSTTHQLPINEASTESASQARLQGHNRLETSMKVALKNVHPNPFRDMGSYPILRTKVDQLKKSIASTSFWDNLVAREHGDGIQIAYGHHRLTALRELYDGDKEFDFIVRDLDDGDMLKIMAHENLDEWATDSSIERETIRAVVKAYAEGSIALAKPDKKMSSNNLRYAPSFCIGINDISRCASNLDAHPRPYAPDPIVAFLGGTLKHTTVKYTLMALCLIEQGHLTEDQLSGLSTSQARTVVDEVKSRRRSIRHARG